jgi:hypothetical protein
LVAPEAVHADGGAQFLNSALAAYSIQQELGSARANPDCEQFAAFTFLRLARYGYRISIIWKESAWLLRLKTLADSSS